MSINCRVSFKNNALEVVDKNGQPSKLYYDALELTGNEDKAFDLWYKAFSQEFTEQVKANNDDVTLDEVLKFVSANSSFRKSLDLSEVREIKDIMDKNSFSTLSSFSKVLNEIFRPDGITELNTRKAYESGLYDLEGLSEVNLDEVDNLLDKIDGTLSRADIYVTPSSDTSANFIDTSKRTILGTPEFISQEEIEEEIISKVESTRDVSEISSLINNLPYSSFAEKFNSNESFKEQILKNIGAYTKVDTLFIEDDIATKKNLTYYNNLRRSVKRDNDVKSLLADVEYLEGIDDNVWAENQEEVKEVLKEIEERQFDENGIDVFGLSKFSSNKKLVLDTLDSLGLMIEKPTNENIFAFSEKFVELVPQPSSTVSEIIPESLEPFSNNVFKVHSTLSETELFRDHGLVKVGENLYHKVDLGKRSDLYEQLYQKAKEEGSPIYLKSEDKREGLRELEQYVMLQDSPLEKDVKEEHILNKLIFNHPKIQDTNDYSQLSDITTDPEYLVGGFPTDFSDYIVTEKQKDSQLYRSTLSKFRVGQAGIYLTSPVSSIEGIDFQKELEDYIRLSKDQSMKYLLPARPTNLKQDAELKAINDPISVPVYSRQYSIDNGLLVTESTPNNNIRFYGKTYSKVAEDTKNSIFKQVPVNPNNNFYSVNKDFITEEDRKVAAQVLNDAKFSFVDSVTTEEDFDNSLGKAGIENEVKFSIGTAYSNEYVALNPDVQIKKGENYQFDLEWDINYKGLPVGKMYYSRPDKVWVDAGVYSRATYDWVLSENKSEAANILAERYKPEEKVDLVDVTIKELMKTANIERSPISKDLIYNGNLAFNIFQLDNELMIESIYSLEPNKGTATAFMRHISEIADRNNMTVTLLAKPFSNRDTKMTFNQLVGFYRKHGFKPDPEFVFDTEEEGLNMIREPRLEQEVDNFDGLQNYERWKGESKEYSRSNIQDIKTGEPVVIKGYHGTTNEFYEFDASIKGNVEGHLGKVNYFTSDYQDASSNYLSEGGDLKQRVQILSERIEDNILQDNLNDADEVDLESVKDTYKLSNEDINEFYPDGIPETIDANEIAKYIANRDFVGSEDIILDLYIKLNNPIVLGKESVWVDAIPESEYSDYLEDAAQEVADENDIDVDEAMSENYGEVVDKAIYMAGAENIVLNALSDALRENGYDSDIASEILSDSGFDFGSELDLNQLEKAVRNYYFDMNDEGDIASNQVIADMFKSLGYDGIILTDVSTRFPNMNLNSKTSHIHVFDEYSNQIKLADGSNTHFGSTSDIRYSITGLNGSGNETVLPVIDKLKQSKLADNVRLMTSKEIDAQLGRLGVNLETRKQVSLNSLFGTVKILDQDLSRLLDAIPDPGSLSRVLSKDITNVATGEKLEKDFNYYRNDVLSYLDTNIKLLETETQRRSDKKKIVTRDGDLTYSSTNRYYRILDKLDALKSFRDTFDKNVFSYNDISVEKKNINFQKSLSEKGVKPIVNGFVYNNDVYLNRDTITNETPIHEFNHLFTNWMKSNRPSLYNQGINLVKQEINKKDSDIANVINYVKQTQPDLKGEKLFEEILTELTGREGADLLESGKKSGIIEWIRSFFKEIGNMLGILDATPEQVAKMTTREFAKSSAVQLLKGEDILSKMNMLKDSVANSISFPYEYTPVNDTVESVAEELRACN